MDDVLATAFDTVVPGLLLIGAVLVPTIIVELIVASVFRVGLRGLKAVVFVNLVTNPALNVALIAVYGFGFGIWQTYTPRHMGPQDFTTHTVWYFYAAFMALEVAVVFIEWALLRWALRGGSLSSGRLLVMAACMNAASACLGIVLSGLVVKV